MIDKLNLEEITFGDFTALLDECGKPHESEFADVVDGKLLKRYFRITKEISFDNLGHVLMAAVESKLYPRCVYSEKARIKVSEARKRTIEDVNGYFTELMRTEEIHSKIFVQLSKNPYVRFYNDTFDFKKKKGKWVFHYSNISRPNFRNYTFEGTTLSGKTMGHELEGTPYISAIFPGL